MTWHEVHDRCHQVRGRVLSQVLEEQVSVPVQLSIPAGALRMVDQVLGGVLHPRQGWRVRVSSASVDSELVGGDVRVFHDVAEARAEEVVVK